MRDGVNLSRLAHGLIGLEAALGVDEVRGEDGVDERRLSETSLTCETRRPCKRNAHARIWTDTYRRR